VLLKDLVDIARRARGEQQDGDERRQALLLHGAPILA
jgi:hypothetical protein